MNSTLSVVTREVFFQLLLPTLLVHLTRGLIVTTLPMFVLAQLELSKTHVGVAIGAIGLGKVASDYPVGILLHRIGARQLMIVCGSVIAASSLLMLLAMRTASFVLVVLAMFLCGVGESTGVISRLSMVSDRVVPSERGRVSALLGGSSRMAMAVGPLIASALTEITGGIGAVFLCQSSFAAASVAVVYFNRVGKPLSRPSNTPSRPLALGKQLFVLLHVAAFTLALQVVRECRKLLLPLAGYEIGLSLRDVSFYSSLSFTIDALLFTVAGQMMDSQGRIFTGVFSTSILVLSILVVVPASAPSILFMHAVIAGLGNGLSSGLVVALGADLAPKTSGRSEFLGLFRLLADCGELIGPLLVGLVAQFTSIPTMINVVAVIGTLGAFWLMIFVAEPASESKKSTDIILLPTLVGNNTDDQKSSPIPTST